MLFHGTSFRPNVESITRNGFVEPHETTADGQYIHIAHGAAWGEGIYFSDDFSFSHMYSNHGNGFGQVGT
jgi:hypothetical protein